MGDLLECNNHPSIENFLDFMLENIMMPQITGPTRLNDRGKYTLIDNIFYNNTNAGRKLQWEPAMSITDHLPNFLTIASDDNERFEKHKIYRRDFTNYNPAAFKLEFSNLNIEAKLQNITRNRVSMLL